MVSITGDRDKTPYERKFAEFIKLLANTPQEVITVHHPEVLGDTYDELVESLNRMADADKTLSILPRPMRTAGVEKW